jgi:hypothetical protein
VLGLPAAKQRARELLECWRRSTTSISAPTRLRGIARLAVGRAGEP